MDKRPFLDRLTEKIAKHTGAILIVLPNRRSQYALTQRLEVANVDMHRITIRTADQLMEELSGMEMIEPEEALLTLYKAYRSCEKNPQSFEDFNPWATTFLADLNDVDLHLANIEDLYHHISEYKSISIDDLEPGPLEKGFRTFWEKLPSYYHALQKELVQIKLGYRGLIYRRVADMVDAESSILREKIGEKTTFWVGVIPGNPSEQKLLGWIRENERLEVFVDVDEYYLKRANHEAGRLFREDPNLHTALWKVNQLETDSKQITEHPVTGVTAQVMRLKGVLGDIPNEEKSDTVIVLCDAKLLTPVLTFFPKDSLNISFGHKLGKTSIHRFVMDWLQMHSSAIELNGEPAFYHKHVSVLLNSPEVSKWLRSASIWERLEPYVLKHNWKYISKQWLQEQLSGDLFNEQAYQMLFDWEKDVLFLAHRISEVLNIWTDGNLMGSNKFEQEALRIYKQKFDQLYTQFGEVLGDTTLPSLRKFIHRHMSHAVFHIAGEFNQGVQLMGLFETRMVDFKHVIFIGASDDNLPGNPNQPTHIPYIHRKEFGLPTIQESQALAAYHFYRLIQRADQVHLIYNTSSEALSGGEESRYMLQLKMELAENNPKLNISDVRQDVDLALESQKEIEIWKSPEVIEAIKAKIGLRLSPSSLNTYINSPLEFYFSHIIGVKEQDKVEEEMEASTFGTAVHQVVEDLYRPFVGKMIDTTALKNSLEQVDEMVTEAFLQEFSEVDIRTGKNHIQVEIAKEYIKTFVKYDLEEMAENGVVKIVSLEERLHEKFTHNDTTVGLVGFADRIDERNGVVRIIDYKTGKVEPPELRCFSHDIFGSSKYSKALQLAFYKWAYSRRHGIPNSEITSMIYSFKRHANGYMPLVVKDEENFVSGFETGLSDVISEMLDETVPFKHHPDSKYTTF